MGNALHPSSRELSPQGEAIRDLGGKISTRSRLGA
jgi:hypothetical protein